MCSVQLYFVVRAETGLVLCFRGFLVTADAQHGERGPQMPVLHADTSEGA